MGGTSILLQLGFLATPVMEFRLELAKSSAMSCLSYCFPSFSHIQPILSIVSRFWEAAGPSPFSAAFQSECLGRLKHDPELEQVPKGRIRFEKRDKICFNGVFRMKYLLVLDISMVENCLLSFTSGQSWILLPQKCPVDWLGLPATDTTLNFKEPEMVKEHLLCQPITANAFTSYFLCVGSILHQLLFFLVPSVTIPIATKVK